MEEVAYNTEELVLKDEKLIDIWGRRNPMFETKYENSVIRIISRYGEKFNKKTDDRGKLFGNGYEPYIIAFFIGLYSKKRIPLSEEKKKLGWALENWGNFEARNLRRPYPSLRTYIFLALVARTDIDWIAVDKGDIKVSSAVTSLINTMEEYANYGFSVMEEKLNEDPGYFFSHRSFLDIFLQLTDQSTKNNQSEEVEEL